jgi:hypothetical protein
MRGWTFPPHPTLPTPWPSAPTWASATGLRGSASAPRGSRASPVSEVGGVQSAPWLSPLSTSVVLRVHHTPTQADAQRPPRSKLPVWPGDDHDAPVTMVDPPSRVLLWAVAAAARPPTGAQRLARTGARATDAASVCASCPLRPMRSRWATWATCSMVATRFVTRRAVRHHDPPGRALFKFHGFDHSGWHPGPQASSWL